MPEADVVCNIPGFLMSRHDLAQFVPARNTLLYAGAPESD
jgi:hypothetical protein